MNPFSTNKPNKIPRLLQFALSLIIIGASYSSAFSQQSSVTVTAQTTSAGLVNTANFELAERFTPQKMDKLIGTTNIFPRWIEDSDDFWYSYETADGQQWYYVHTDERRQRPLFDQDDIAGQTSWLWSLSTLLRAYDVVLFCRAFDRGLSRVNL
jgi:hypothetical protein